MYMPEVKYNYDNYQEYLEAVQETVEDFPEDLEEYKGEHPLESKEAFKEFLDKVNTQHIQSEICEALFEDNEYYSSREYISDRQPMADTIHNHLLAHLLRYWWTLRVHTTTENNEVESDDDIDMKIMYNKMGV